MKNFLLLCLAVLISNSALAMPVIYCQNPATGATFDVSVYSGQPPFYMANSILMNAFERQGVGPLPTQGTGGVVSYNPVTYSVTTSHGLLRLTPSGNGGYLLSLFITTGPVASFYFNSGECR